MTRIGINNQAVLAEYSHHWYNIVPAIALTSAYPPGTSQSVQRLFVTPFNIAKHSFVATYNNIRLYTFANIPPATAIGLRTRLVLLLNDGSVLNGTWITAWAEPSLASSNVNNTWGLYGGLIYCYAGANQVFADILTNNFCIGLRVELEWTGAVAGFSGNIYSECSAQTCYFLMGCVRIANQVT